MHREAGFLLVLLFLADFLMIQADSTTLGETTPATARNRRIAAQPPYVLKPETILYLDCRTQSKLPIYWQRNSQDITNDTEHYELLEDGKKICIKLPHTEILLGNYTCKHNTSAPENLSFFRVIDVPRIILSGDSTVVEREKLNLQCRISAEGLRPKIAWTFGNSTYTASRGRVQLSKDPETGVENSFLTVENISMSDAGPILCNASLNVVGRIDVNGFTQLTVRSESAVFWQNFGISVGTIALCAILGAIFFIIYKKKRNKAEFAGSDTEHSPVNERLNARTHD